MIYGFCPFESTTIPKLIEVLKETELEFPTKEQVSEETKRLLKKLLTKDPTKRIEWMELLKVNITNEGKLVGNKQERLSLVEEDGQIEGGKLVESGKLSDSGAGQVRKNQDNLVASTQSYSPPST
jgi:serine/threonine protein kinase